MSEPTSEQIETTPKRRSPLERVIVWGLIVSLLVVVVFEGRSYWGFIRAYRPIVTQLQEADVEGGSLKEADVQMMVGNMVPERQPIHGILRTASREDAYVWPGLIKDRHMFVYYGVGDDPDVLFVTTVKEPPPAEFNWEAFGYTRVPQEGAQPVNSPSERLQ